MRNKFLLILLIFTVGVMGTANATLPESVDKIDKIKIYNLTELQCIGAECEKKSENSLIYPCMRSLQAKTVSNIVKECKPEEAVCLELVEDGISINAKAAYDKEDFEAKVTVKYRCSTGDHEEVECACDMKGLYKKITIGGKEFWVYSDLLKDIEVKNDERILFCLDNLNQLCLITFNPEEIDLYTEGRCGSVTDYEDTSKYGIVPIYSEEGDSFNDEGFDTSTYERYIPNNGVNLQGKQSVFFVCKNCAKCAQGGCSNLVASDGSLTGKAPGNEGGPHLSKYCAQDHACGFFWDISNGGEDGYYIGSTEGVVCADECRTGNSSVFCESHTCHSSNCNKAVIGVNMLDGRVSWPRVYKGENKKFYSNYCIEHFCREYGCTNPRILPGSTGWYTEENESVLKSFPKYCEKHCNDCTIVGCTEPVTSSSYQASGNKLVCQNHISIGTEGTEELIKHKCSKCGKVNVLTVFHNENYFCAACVDTILSEDGAENLVTILGNDGTRLNVTDLAQNELLDTLTIKNKEENTEYEKCKQCSEIHTFVVGSDGQKYCSSCCYSIDGSGDKLQSSQITQDPTDDGTSTQSTGSEGDLYSAYYGSSTTDTSSTATTTTDETQCVHSNYPVPNTVTFTNKTATTHLQVWTCTNCNSLQSVTYEHTYINKVCVCGYEQDSEKPTVELLEPSEASEAEPGEEVILKVTDNKELKHIKYKWFGVAEETETITKNFTGGTLQEVSAGKLPTESGTYTLYVNEVADTAGNTMGDLSFIFTIKNNESTKVDSSEDDTDSEVYLPSDDTVKPTIKLVTGNTINDKITEKFTNNIDLNDSKVSIILSDNKGLKSIKYTCLWTASKEPIEIDLGGKSSYTLDISDISGESRIMLISEIADTAGNRLEDVYLIFNIPEEEKVEEKVDEKDETAPRVGLVSPENLSKITSGTLAEFKISDNKGIGKIKYTIKNSRQQDMTPTNEIISDGALEQTLKMRLEGEYTGIEFNVTDINGNESLVSYTFEVENETVSISHDGGYFAYDTEKPKIELVISENSTDWKNSNEKIKIRFSDNEGLDSAEYVVVYSDDVVSDLDIFGKKVDGKVALVLGSKLEQTEEIATKFNEHKVMVVYVYGLKDINGNESSARYTFTLKDGTNGLSVETEGDAGFRNNDGSIAPQKVIVD